MLVESLLYILCCHPSSSYSEKLTAWTCALEFQTKWNTSSSIDPKMFTLARLTTFQITFEYGRLRTANFETLYKHDLKLVTNMSVSFFNGSINLIKLDRSLCTWLSAFFNDSGKDLPVLRITVSIWSGKNKIVEKPFEKAVYHFMPEKRIIRETNKHSIIVFVFVVFFSEFSSFQGKRRKTSIFYYFLMSGFPSCQKRFPSKERTFLVLSILSLSEKVKWYSSFLMVYHYYGMKIINIIRHSFLLRQKIASEDETPD